MKLVTKPRVVVHIGPMKTGTTALGVYFSDATAAGILPKNVVYPTGDLWFPAAGRITKHGQLFDFLVDRTANTALRKTPIRDAAEVEAKVKAAADYASSLKEKDPTVVYINETLSSRPNTEKLVAMLGKYFSSITFVLAVRSPVAAASSLLVHRIKDWRIPQLDLDLPAMITGATGDIRFNYARIIDRWMSNKSVKTVLIPIFEDEPDGYASVDRFFTVVTGSPAARLGDDFGSRRIHPSLPLKSLTRLIALKKANGTFGKIPFVSSILHRIFMRVLLTDRHKAVRDGFSDRGKGTEYWNVNASDRAVVLDIYSPSFDTIRASLGKSASSPEWRTWFEAAQR